MAFLLTGPAVFDFLEVTEGDDEAQGSSVNIALDGVNLVMEPATVTLRPTAVRLRSVGPADTYPSCTVPADVVTEGSILDAVHLEFSSSRVVLEFSDGGCSSTIIDGVYGFSWAGMTELRDMGSNEQRVVRAARRTVVGDDVTQLVETLAWKIAVTSRTTK